MDRIRHEIIIGTTKVGEMSRVMQEGRLKSILSMVSCAFMAQLLLILKSTLTLEYGLYAIVLADGNMK